MAAATGILRLLPDNLVELLDVPSKSIEFLMEGVSVIGVTLPAAGGARDLETESDEVYDCIVLFGAGQVG